MSSAASSYFRRLSACFNGLRRSNAENPPARPVRIQLQVERLNSAADTQRLRAILGTIPGVVPLDVDAETGWVDLECQGTKLVEIAVKIASVGFSVSRTRLLAPPQSESRRALCVEA